MEQGSKKNISRNVFIILLAIVLVSLILIANQTTNGGLVSAVSDLKHTLTTQILSDKAPLNVSSEQQSNDGETVDNALDPSFDPDQAAIMLADMDARQQQLAAGYQLMEQANQRIVNSTTSLSNVQKKMDDRVIGEQQRLAAQQELTTMSVDSSASKTLDPAKQMTKLTERKHQSNPKIPEKVLQDIQQSTGITADEIDELMNR